jgi:hypothetical protein
MDVAKIAAQQLIGNNGIDPARDQSFRMVFQEQIANSNQQNGVASPASLMRAIGQNFIETESRLQVEKLNLMTAYIGPLANAAQPAGSGMQTQRAGIIPANFTGEAGGVSGAGSNATLPPVTQTSSPSQGFQIDRSATGMGVAPFSSGGASTGYERASQVRPPAHSEGRTIYAESRNDTPTPMQAALGLSSDANTNTFDFASNIQAMTNKINAATGQLKQEMTIRPKNIEEVTRHNSQVQARIREIDDMSSQRSMLSSLHVSNFQENRTRMLSVYEHVTGAFKKINEIVNSLKQSS